MHQPWDSEMHLPAISSTIADEKPENHTNHVMKGVCILLTFVCFLAVSLSSYAQGAFVSPKGTGYVGISYQNNFSDRHAFSNGDDYLVVNGQRVSEIGSMRFQSVYLDFGYSLTDKLAFSVSLPYTDAKYTAPDSPPIPGFGPHKLSNGTIPIDDGHYHGGFQDFTFRARYNVALHPVVITPFLQYGFPSNSYPFYSHAVIGNRVAEFQIGSYFGGTLSFLPNAYLQGGYSVGFPQKILGISKIHQHMEFEGGYFITERMRAFGILIGQVSNGGLDLNQDLSYPCPPCLFPDFGPPVGRFGYTDSNEDFLHHLQVQRDNFLDISGGMSYSLSGAMDIYGVVVHTLTARNLHEKKYGLAFGFSWGFGGSPQRPCHC